MSKSNLRVAVHKLALAGEQAGFTIEELTKLLDGGVSMEALLDLIALRLVEPDRNLPESTCRWIM